ncbi:MAG TPA: ABC transporter permease [Stellaceae bacterium]|nr:ABC transporter permease [Stellaceae bacterium]
MKRVRSLLRRVEPALIPLINLSAALVLSALVVLVTGSDPIAAMIVLATGAAGDGASLGYTLYYATNFILTGLAVALPFHAGIFNIGGEGQAYIGGLLASLVCLLMGPALGWAAIPLAILAAAVGGALWALVPAWLFVARGSHVVITTIMFNFIASAVMTFLIVNVLIAPGQSSPESVAFLVATWMPSLGALLGPSPLNLTFPLALLLAIAVWGFLRLSKQGFEIRAAGANPEAARAGGISVGAATVLALTLGGALAGLVAVNELMGAQHRLLLDFPAGYGFMGIAVALMGRNHPLGICLAALFFGALYQGGTELSFDMPKVTRDIVVVIEGLAVLFCGALENLFRTRIANWLGREAPA